MSDVMYRRSNAGEVLPRVAELTGAEASAG